MEHPVEPGAPLIYGVGDMPDISSILLQESDQHFFFPNQLFLFEPRTAHKLVSTISRSGVKSTLHQCKVSAYYCETQRIGAYPRRMYELRPAAEASITHLLLGEVLLARGAFS